MEPDKDILEQCEFNFANGIGELPTSVQMPKKIQKDYFYGTTSTLVNALILIYIIYRLIP